MFMTQNFTHNPFELLFRLVRIEILVSFFFLISSLLTVSSWWNLVCLFLNTLRFLPLPLFAFSLAQVIAIVLLDNHPSLSPSPYLYNKDRYMYSYAVLRALILLTIHPFSCFLSYFSFNFFEDILSLCEPCLIPCKRVGSQWFARRIVGEGYPQETGDDLSQIIPQFNMKWPHTWESKCKCLLWCAAVCWPGRLLVVSLADRLLPADVWGPEGQ